MVIFFSIHENSQNYRSKPKDVNSLEVIFIDSVV